MEGRNVLFACCVFLLSGIKFSTGQSDQCDRFEIVTGCADWCNTCEAKQPCDETTCIPGCTCLPGFSRDSTGQCIPQQLCNLGDTSVQGRSLLGGGLSGGLSQGGRGCPNIQNCVLSCRLRNFEDGICLGPGREFCNCFTLSTTPL